MNMFQVAGVTVATLMAIVTAVGAVRRRHQMRVRLALSIVWVAAAAAILHPEVSMRIANLVGIGRGADLVLYLVTLASIAAFFAVYLRFVALESQITALVRHLALAEARRDERRDTAASADEPHEA